jgi:hypothetical protein
VVPNRKKLSKSCEQFLLQVSNTATSALYCVKFKRK